MSQVQKLVRSERRLMIGALPMAIYFLIFFLFPLIYIIINSFWSADSTGMVIDRAFTLKNYQSFFTNQFNIVAYLRTIGVSFSSVLMGIVLAVPLSYAIVFVIPKKWKQLVLLAIVTPFWTSFIIRAFSWQLFLSEGGPLNSFLMKWGLINQPISILYTHKATIIGLGLFSMMIVLVNTYSIMVGIDRSLLEAVSDLGGGKWDQFVEVILPLSVPGIVLGSMLSLIICIGDYIAPTLLGGGVKTVLSQLMIQSLKSGFNIPMASTYSVIMLLTILIFVLPFVKYIKRGRTGE